MLDSLASFFTINFKKKEKKERHNSYNHTNNHSTIIPFLKFKHFTFIGNI